MLNTQIQYWANVEAKRHNFETETQNWEDLRRKELEYYQTVKYQAEQVGYWYDQLKEEIRHNKVNEKIGLKQAKASILQAHAAAKTASANLQNAMTNLYKAHTDRKAYESTAKYQKAMSDKAKMEKYSIAANTKYKQKETKYYFWSDVVPKYLNAGTKTLDVIGGVKSAGKGIKSVAKKKK